METTLSTLFKYIQPVIEKSRNLWKSSKFFRITTIVFGSLTASLLLRNVYVTAQKKYLGLPPGKLGIPFIGGFAVIAKPGRLSAIMKNPATSMTMGNNYAILINNPYLAKKYYSNPRTVDLPSSFISDLGFAFINGKPWAQRRRIISANLMSTMNSSYIEDVTKKFIKTKLFPVFDEDILNGVVTDVKPLFRPIGFNIVLQSCFGAELESLKDPFWIKFDKSTKESNKKMVVNLLVTFLLGGNKFSESVQRMFTGTTFGEGFDNLINIIDDFTKEINIDKVEKENNVKLFNDYIKDYMNNINDQIKWTRQDLLGDMMTMFAAATDTTYSALASSLLLAAKYPNIQQEIYKEIIDAFGNNVDNIELRNGGLSKIPKLRAFIHECLRIFPPSNVTGMRQLNGKTIKLNTSQYGANKDYNVPDKTITMINVFGIGQEPKYWIEDYEINKNKAKYKNINMKKPHFDFWLDNNGKFIRKKNSASFFSFHIGKRDCVGQSLAMKELIIVLAMIFMKYKIESKSGNTDFEIGSKFSGTINEPLQTEIRLKNIN